MTYGGGGAGQQSGVGQGGGRTAIQSIDSSGSSILLRDRVVAAGGGGSTGSGVGGNAGAFVRDSTGEYSVAENGLPALNGGRGSIFRLSSSDSFFQNSKGQPGLGGAAQGLN